MSTRPPITLAQRLRTEPQQFRELIRQAFCDLRVAIPGIVQSFDAAKMTVRVRPALRESIWKNFVPTPTLLPDLLDVPLVVYGTAHFILTLPVQSGDECLVIFADMCIDAWWQNGGVQNQIEMRRHDLSDGFAILAPWSQPRVIANYSTTAAELRNADNSVSISLAANALTLKAPTINIQASQVNTTGGATSIEGKDFATHRHTGVSTGSGESGPVA